MTSPTLEFKLNWDLSEHLKGQAVLAQAICFDGSLAVVTTAPELKDLAFGRTEQPGFATFPATMAASSYEVTVHLFGPQTEMIKTVSIPGCSSAYPLVQSLPDNSILLVSSRCRYSDNGPELNASVYSSEGKLLRQFCLGDGINNVLVTPSAEIWVGYFDEGVFGNFGWKEPMGAAGLNCFDSEGKISWCYDDPPDGFDYIADCYAMTLSGDDLWACYYTDFPVVRIDKSKKITCWHNDTCGASVLATNGRSVLFYGGYGDKRHDCFVSRLGDSDSVAKPVQYELSLAEGLDQASVLGHGRNLHAFVDSRWYTLSIDDL
ncbi:hypothetical protein BH10CYA1_BH10CYA1_16520 [soil metagenome]